MSRYTGRCACGAVTAVIEGAPLAVRQCWCRQCQQVAAGSPTNNAMFRLEDVQLRGSLATRVYVAASGNSLTQSFCPSCGTPVMAQSSARPELRTFRLGFLQAPHDLVPEMAIWTEEAPGWAVPDSRLTRFPRQPPAPQAKR